MTLATLKQTWQAFNDDKAPRLAAAIAYSTIFSLAPLLVILIAVVGNVLDANGSHGGHSSAEQALLSEIGKSAGAGAADTVKQLIAASFNKPRQGLIAQIIGWIAFVIGASGLFASLQDALNTVWQVEAAKGGWQQMVRDRIVSFGMILAVGFLLLVTFVANGAITFIGTNLLNRVPFAANPIAISLIDQVVSIALVTLTFALIFKVLPDVDISWRDVIFGAALTAVMFVVGEALIGLYIAKAGIASAYGAAGSILVALLWIYYSAMILLLGAEFTKVHAGKATLSTSARVRQSSDAPAGADPRYAQKPS
jgi:membrane protein